MKKLLFLGMLFMNGFLFSASCPYLSGIEKDPLASSVISSIKSLDYEKFLYCDSTGKKLLYYLNGTDGLQVGLSYYSESISNDFNELFKAVGIDLEKIVKSVRKNYKNSDSDSTLIFRIYINTPRGLYGYGKIIVPYKGKPYAYYNEKFANYTTYWFQYGKPSLLGQPYLYVGGIHESKKYTSDIIY